MVVLRFATPCRTAIKTAETSVATPHTTITAPVARPIQPPHGNTFSTRTSSAMPTIQSMFITPRRTVAPSGTSSSRDNTRRAPAHAQRAQRPARQLPIRKPSGERQWRRQHVLNGVSCHRAGCDKDGGADPNVGARQHRRHQPSQLQRPLQAAATRLKRAPGDQIAEHERAVGVSGAPACLLRSSGRTAAASARRWAASSPPSSPTTWRTSRHVAGVHTAGSHHPAVHAGHARHRDGAHVHAGAEQQPDPGERDTKPSAPSTTSRSRRSGARSQLSVTGRPVAEDGIGEPAIRLYAFVA